MNGERRFSICRGCGMLEGAPHRRNSFCDPLRQGLPVKAEECIEVALDSDGDQILAGPYPTSGLSSPEAVREQEVLDRMAGADPWAHRSAGMKCRTCMWFVEKARPQDPLLQRVIGRCRRHAPTMNGYPVVFAEDWCGDHKLDEGKA